MDMAPGESYSTTESVPRALESGEYARYAPMEITDTPEVDTLLHGTFFAVSAIVAVSAVFAAILPWDETTTLFPNRRVFFDVSTPDPEPS